MLFDSVLVCGGGAALSPAEPLPTHRERVWQHQLRRYEQACRDAWHQGGSHLEAPPLGPAMPPPPPTPKPPTPVRGSYASPPPPRHSSPPASRAQMAAEERLQKLIHSVEDAALRYHAGRGVA